MPDQPGTPNPHRLPRTVVPNRYDLVLQPDLEAGTFSGTVTIGVEVLEPIEELVLHAAELEIDAASMTYADGSTATLATRLDDEAERLICTPTDAPALAGPAAVSFTFRGILNDKLRGFYRSTFTDADVPYLQVLQRKLNHAISVAAARAGATYADIYPASLAHSACSPESVRWVEPVEPGGGGTNSLHPSLAGERAMAVALVRATTYP